MDTAQIQKNDGELFDLLRQEEFRQENTLDMVASESIQDAISLALSGSAFCCKTAVGTPGKQRLLGSDIADKLEVLAAQRACEVFGAEHANMLPYSGTTANLCVYDGLLQPGDTIVAIDPEHGSHASHGRKEHVSAKLYHFVHVGVDPCTQLLNYETLAECVRLHRPKLIVIGVSSYPRQIDYEKIKKIAHDNDAVFMVDMAHITGLVAAGVLPNPMEHADIVTGSGTKTMCSCHTGFILCRKPFAEAVDRGVYPGVLASMHLQSIAAVTWALKRSQTPKFVAMMHQTVANAKALCIALQERGFGILTGGTDCHMFVLDLRPTGVGANIFAQRLEKIGISVNTKRIPYDPAPTTNGIRAGCTVLTQRGMQETQMQDIADIFMSALTNNPILLEQSRQKIAALCNAFPPLIIKDILQ